MPLLSPRMNSGMRPASDATNNMPPQTAKRPSTAFTINRLPRDRVYSRLPARGGQDHEIIAAVLCPGGFTGTGGDGFVLAESFDVEAAGIDSLAGQIFTGGEGAAFAKRTVVFLGAALVAVAFDADGVIRVA